MVTTFVQHVGARITGSDRESPSSQAEQSFQNATDVYARNERYYDNTMYAAVEKGRSELGQRIGLYRRIRPIRNPLRRAVDFYPGKLFPGAMTPDGLAMPDGTPSCLPFAGDTDRAVRLAFAQAFSWGNFGSKRYAFGRNLAILGDQFGEVHVDYERRKVYPRFYHPKFVRNAIWNGSDDLVAYHLEIPIRPGDGKPEYRWGKVVTKDTITTLYNDQPHSYDGQDAVIDNPWRFCPAAWCQFRNVGTQHGAALSDGMREKLDELNSSLANIHDYIGKFSQQGIVFKTASSISEIVVFTPGSPRESADAISYLKGPTDLEIDRLIENLGLGESEPFIAKQIAEVEADLPEARFDEQIREHPQIAGVALRMMFPSIESRLFEVQGNADDFVITLGQMCLTIGGELIRAGEWGLPSELTEAQQRFAPFSLASFDRGEIEVSFLPRPLFSETPAERIEQVKAREAVQTATGLRELGYEANQIEGLLRERRQANAAESAIRFANAGWSLPAIAREIGKTDDEIAQILADSDVMQERARAAFDAGEEQLMQQGAAA